MKKKKTFRITVIFDNFQRYLSDDTFKFLCLPLKFSVSTPFYFVENKFNEKLFFSSAKRHKRSFLLFTLETVWGDFVITI